MPRKETYMRRALALLLPVLMMTAFLTVFHPASAVSAETDPGKQTEALLTFSRELNEMVGEYAPKAEKSDDPYGTARLIVKCGAAPDLSDAVAYVYGCGRYVIQYSSPNEARKAAERLRLLDTVEYAVPDAIVSVSELSAVNAAPMQEPNVDSFHSWGYGADYIDAYAFNEWLLEQAGGDVNALPEIIVAVIDTGLETGLPYFSGRTVPGYDFADNDNDVTGGFFHGTHVAGTVVDGTLPNVRIMPLKCTDDYGSAITSNIINCMQYAYLHGAQVANVSIGGYYPETFDAYTSVINAGSDAGTVYCVASGNDGTNVGYCYPACIERAFTVAAHDRNFNMWSGSNTGNSVDITAPGVDIVSAMPNGSFQAQTGTSMAAPHAAAACAMLKSLDPDLSADEVMDMLRSAAVDHGLSGGGAGILSMTALIGGTEPPPTPPPQILPGDVNCDGIVDSVDALMALRCAMGIVQLEGDALIAGDIDGNGLIESIDALIILRRAMGLA